MNIHWFAAFLAQHRELVVFINVLLQQIGLPVPAVPTMMLNASQSDSIAGLPLLLIAAVAASLLADLIWYQAGKLFGYSILKFLCKMSINPGSCVNQTEARFVKWGIWSLIFGKFIPGFSTVAPPVAGALGMSRSKFLIASAIGAALWAGFALLAGYALQAQIDIALQILAEHGIQIAAVFATMLLVWIAWKFWQKKRFEKLADMPHVSPDDLLQSIRDGKPLRVIDLRSQALIAETGIFPDALVSEVAQVASLAPQLRRDEFIVTFCACPDDAGAVHAAHTLQRLGFNNVRPLSGGLEAWSHLAHQHDGLLIKPV